MLFNSIAYIVFFPTVVFLYFALKHKYRNFFLLAASILFYMWALPWYIFVLIFLILVDYLAAIYIDKSQGGKRRNFLIVSIVSTCLVLFIFKYYSLFNEVTTYLLSHINISYSPPRFSLLLPIGLSFHTFQSLSYVIEVYKGNFKPERNLITYALYVMFFPQLVAGPIERPQHMIPQFYEKHVFKYEDMVAGLRLILWGLFKKVVVADRIALLVDLVYSNPSAYHGLPLLITIFLFSIQIYLDFSAYSDIARGSARCMGFDLSINFKRPFFAVSMTDFWRRWHISLTSWFRDYVYIPLGGNKVSKIRQSFNVLIIFLLSGLWHGAGIQFIVWGLINGVFIVLERIGSGFRKIFIFKGVVLSRFINILRSIWVFMVVSIAFVFFRAKDVPQAIYIIKHSVQDLGPTLVSLWELLRENNFAKVTGYLFEGSVRRFDIFNIIFLVAIVFLVEAIFEFSKSEKGSNSNRMNIADKAISFFYRYRSARWAIYCVLIGSILIIGVFKQTPFIYFQF